MSFKTFTPPILGDTFIFYVGNLLIQSWGWRSLMLPCVEIHTGAECLGWEAVREGSKLFQVGEQRA